MATRSTSRHFSSHRGFTLIEMVMTIVILAIVAGILAPIMSSALSGFQSARVRNELTAQSRVVMERLTREIREADPNPARLTVTGGNTLQFRQLLGLIGLTYAGPTVIKTYNACKSVRISPSGANLIWTDDTSNAVATSSVLATNLGSIGFTYTPGATNRSGIVSVDLVLTDGTETISVHREIHIRNTLGLGPDICI